MAVLGAEVQDGGELEALTELHSRLRSRSSRLARAYRGRLHQSHGTADARRRPPAGRVAVISPGEPLNIKDVGAEWILDWRSVCTQGETIVGPPPREIGPEITDEAFRRAVELQLDKWTQDVRAPWVAYVPAHQGYIVVTICRALYALSTGEQTSKEEAVAWAAERFPAWSDFVNDALAQYRATRSNTWPQSPSRTRRHPGSPPRPRPKGERVRARAECATPSPSRSAQAVGPARRVRRGRLRDQSHDDAASAIGRSRRFFARPLLNRRRIHRGAVR